MDFFEISDLTIDCDLEHQTHDIAAGAIRIKGNHSRIRRIKAVNWGTRTTSKACYVIASIAADAGATIPGMFDTVIDECIAVEPDSSSLSDGIIAVLHIGDRGETAGLPDFPEPTGESAVIRNCFVDCGQTDLAGDTQDI